MGLITLALQASEAAVPIKAVGISPTGWITAVGVLVSAIIGTGGVYGIFKGLALLYEQKTNRAKHDDDAAAVVRREMMEFNEKLQVRIDGLESTGRDDRKRFDEEMALVRREHVEEVTRIRSGYEGEIRALREEITGLRRQMVQWQQVSGAAVNLAGKAPTSAMKRVDESGLGDVLRSAFDVPGIGEE